MKNIQKWVDNKMLYHYNVSRMFSKQLMKNGGRREDGSGNEEESLWV